MAQSIVVLKRAHFFSLDNDLIDVHAKTIGALGIAVYAVLARYANCRTGECWPAIARIERVLGLARSTVKCYLHKLEAAGLIAIEERRSAAGDPTSNLYTLLDPSPAAVAQRQATETAPPVPEGGRPPADLPPVASQPGGGPAAAPEPDLTLQNTKKENHKDDACTREDKDQQPHDTPDRHDSAPTTDAPQPSNTPPVRPNRPPCVHPEAEVRHFDAIAVCCHCWTMIDVTVSPAVAHTQEAPEEGTTTARAA